MIAYRDALCTYIYYIHTALVRMTRAPHIRLIDYNYYYFFSVTLYNIILSLYIAGGTLRLMRARTSNVCVHRGQPPIMDRCSSDLMTEISLYAHPYNICVCVVCVIIICRGTSRIRKSCRSDRASRYYAYT